MHWFQETHRRAIRAKPFPPEWLDVIQRNVPYFRLLTPDEQHELQGLIAIFLDEKVFEGCGGLHITDEIRVTIAAQACILLLHRHNVVYHEFAHQLDAEDGEMSGAPALPHRLMYSSWARVLGMEYEHWVQETHRRHRTVLDPYGANNPAEFFAVATETFFEKPAQLTQKHPELYAELKLFYNQDPAARLRPAGQS